MRTRSRTTFVICSAVVLLSSAHGAEQRAHGQATPPRLTVPSADKPDGRIPKWAQQARWYHVIVPVFHNGDPSNDPPGTVPWSSGWPSAAGTSADKAGISDAHNYGGDLLGLTKRLSYLKELGVNTLHLSAVFMVDQAGQPDVAHLRHVDDSVGVKGSYAKLAEETADPKTWKFSASDRAFLDVIKTAHKAGIRVVLDVAFDKNLANEHLTLVAQRWMDPDGDKDPSDGVDGWVVRDPQKAPHKFWKQWCKKIKKINPSVLLVCDVEGKPKSWLSGDEFDVAMDRRLARELTQFFMHPHKPTALTDFMKALTAIDKNGRLGATLATPRPLHVSSTSRMLNALESLPRPPAKPDMEAVARWRLATAVLGIFPGAPVILYGDEVGIRSLTGSSTPPPMWWKDLANAQPKPRAYRDDFASLVQWLNLRRDIHTPLRAGSFRVLMQDAGQEVFALIRSLPDDEAILVVNYGKDKRQLTLTAGKPGQLVGVLSPKFDQPARGQSSKKPSESKDRGGIIPLHLGGSRQYVDPGGRIHLRMDPMSIRMVIVRKGLR